MEYSISLMPTDISVVITYVFVEDVKDVKTVEMTDPFQVEYHP